MDLIIFNSNIDFLLNKTSNYKGFWYDGKSDLIKDIFKYHNDYNLVYIEESIEERVSSITGLTDFKTFKSLDLSKEPKNVGFFPSNDTIAYLLYPVSKSIKCHFSFYISKFKNENAEQALKLFNQAYKYLSFNTIKYIDTLILGNDWGNVEKLYNYIFQLQNKNTFCVQESIIDFNTEVKRMEQCTFPLIQGIISSTLLNRKIYFLTGNPRYEKLNTSPLPPDNNIMVNSNFTYGIFENVRDNWIKDITSLAEKYNFKYFISQHPRESREINDKNVIKSNATSIHDQIKSCSLLITRFSSLIHEAIALGRPVIYYNPHKEALNYDFEPDNNNLVIAKNSAELEMYIFKLSINKYGRVMDVHFQREYLTRHIGSSDKLARNRIAEVISRFALSKTNRYHPRIFKLLRLYIIIKLKFWYDSIRKL